MALQPAILGIPALGNFRLGYVFPEALTTVRSTRVRVALAGLEVRTRVEGMSVHEVVNETPDSCSLTIDAPRPSSGQPLRITVNSDTPRLLFSGTIQSDDMTYEGLPEQLAYPVNAVDDTLRANKRRPLGTFVNVSATTIGQYLVANHAPGFSAAGIALGLPLVSIVFDGATSFMGCMTQLATAIGGYCNARDGVIYLFLVDTSDPVDPITDGYPFLDDPPIRITRDDSQLITRCNGKGHHEALLADVAAGETTLPLNDAAMYEPAGGQVIASTTADGAQSEVLSYTGVHLGNVGSLVGPGVAPSTAPVTTPASGAGLTNGTYQYAYTDVTAAGESMPSPLATVTVASPLAAPGYASAVEAFYGANLGLGIYQYGVTNVNAAGETTAGPVTALTTYQVATPTLALTAVNDTGPSGYGPGGGWPTAGQSVTFRLTFVNGAGETMVGPASTAITAQAFIGGSIHNMFLSLPGENPAGATARRIYMYVNGVYSGWYSDMYAAWQGGGYSLSTTSASLADFRTGSLPVANTANMKAGRVVCVAGPAGTTGRKIYRTVVGGSQLKLLATLADNVTQVFTDNAVGDGSLGANVPVTNTAAMAQVALSVIAPGPTGTTARKVYRTTVGGVQLKLQQTIADNATTTGVTDVTADGSLGANAPTGDTSGLTTTVGQVNAGSTSLRVAGAPFPATGGWVRVGEQIIRFTGISVVAPATSLTGIPPSGPGSILVTIPFGSQVVAAPMLTGVTGLTKALLKGSSIAIWVVRNALAAQAAAALRESTPTYTSDGIHEFLVVDERRGADSLRQRCDVHLAMFANPITTVRYATRDIKTGTGKPVTFLLTSPPIDETLVIQDVTISEIDVSPGTPPRYDVLASSVRFSLEDWLRRVNALL